MGKLTTMKEAVERYVTDGMVIYITGFTHLIGYAAAHEIIRQKKKNLTLCKETPELFCDEMIVGGCLRKIVFSWAGNPGVGLLHAFRRAVENGEIDIEEYTHFGMTAMLQAGAMGIPFMPIRTNVGSDLPKYNPNIKSIENPYDKETLSIVPALNPDVTFIHVQRADENGNLQAWGIFGPMKEAALAAKKVVATAEEIVDEEVIRSDPNRTILPGFAVDAVVEEPWAAHPSYAQGYYHRDNDFYIQFDTISRDEKKYKEYMNEWVYGVENRAEYIRKFSAEKLLKLLVKSKTCVPVNYGAY
jgi:glutaconate CoA-transferase subunit A